MKTIRKNVFETNSSSCHAVVYANDADEIERFKQGKLWFDSYSRKLRTPEELYEELKGELKDSMPEDFTFEVFKFLIKYPDVDRNFWISPDNICGLIPSNVYTYSEVEELTEKWTTSSDYGDPSGITEMPDGRFKIDASWYE